MNERYRTTTDYEALLGGAGGLFFVLCYHNNGKKKDTARHIQEAYRVDTMDTSLGKERPRT